MMKGPTDKEEVTLDLAGHKNERDGRAAVWRRDAATSELEITFKKPIATPSV